MILNVGKSRTKEEKNLPLLYYLFAVVTFLTHIWHAKVVAHMSMSEEDARQCVAAQYSTKATPLLAQLHRCIE